MKGGDVQVKVTTHILPEARQEAKNANISYYGTVDVELDVGIKLNGIKVKSSTREDPKGRFFLEMPVRQGRDGQYFPVFRPTSAEARRALTDAVLNAIKAQKDSPQTAAPPPL